jgi:hypothetical protein
MAREMTWDTVVAGLAARVYDGYGDDADWKTFDGRPMPRWHELPYRTRRHWCAGVAVIARPAELQVPEPSPTPCLRADATDDDPEEWQ